MQYTVREAAKASGLWKTAPALCEVSPKQMQFSGCCKFDCVITADEETKLLSRYTGLN